MKPTIEADVMDSERLKEGDAVALGWQSLEGPMQPDEEAMAHEEEGEDDGSSRGVVVYFLLSYLLRDFRRNGSALDIGRRVLAMAKFIEHPSLGGWSATELAKACGEPPATMVERVRRECNRIVEAMGGVGHARWQQGPEQRKISAAAQKGNHNRVKNLKR
jgi:hypothetical protein